MQFRLVDVALFHLLLRWRRFRALKLLSFSPASVGSPRRQQQDGFPRRSFCYINSIPPIALHDQPPRISKGRRSSVGRRVRCSAGRQPGPLPSDLQGLGGIWAMLRAIEEGEIAVRKARVDIAQKRSRDSTGPARTRSCRPEHCCAQGDFQRRGALRRPLAWPHRLVVCSSAQAGACGPARAGSAHWAMCRFPHPRTPKRTQNRNSRARRWQSALTLQSRFWPLQKNKPDLSPDFAGIGGLGDSPNPDCRLRCRSAGSVFGKGRGGFRSLRDPRAWESHKRSRNP
jgi:hypothetical protein